MSFPKFTKTKLELCELCGGISRPSMDKFLAMPGAPKEVKGKGWPVEQVRKFILANTSKGSIAASLDDDFDKLRKWDVYERARKAQIVNDQKVGKLVMKDQVEGTIAAMAAECQRVLWDIPRMAPDLVGRSIEEIEIRLKEGVTTALTKLRNGK